MLEKLKRIKALRIAAICVLTYLFIGVLVSVGALALTGELILVGGVGAGVRLALTFLKITLSWPMILWFLCSVMLHGF